LVLLGYYATREIFRFYNLPIPERRKFRETTGKLYWQNIKIYPVIHPAAALHKSELLPVLQQNFQKIQVLQQSCFWLQECILRKFESSGVIGLYWKHHYCCGDWSRCQRYLRLNKHIPYPENLLPDGSCIEM
ncbi:MAG: hypothetical protein JXB60_03530, partial [Candidatus Cloacimonetes bacterium]|nr:hypothetical protein [Candidatus Cloacimonadota bacterium]